MTERTSHGLVFFGRVILAGLALAMAAFAVQILLLFRLSTALRAIDPRPGMLRSIPNDGVLIAGLFVLAALGLAAILAGFFLGIAHCRRVGEAAGLTGYSYGMGWTVGAFFVPLFNLYRPWVGLGEIRRAIFVALETGQSGKRWNKFGDVSYATIALAIAIIGGIFAQIVYNLMAGDMHPAVTSAQVLVRLAHFRGQILVNGVFLALEGAAFFAYLATLARPLRRLSSLAAEGALLPPA